MSGHIKEKIGAKIRQVKGRWQRGPSERLSVPVQVTLSLWAQVSHEELRMKLEGTLNLIFKKLRMI